MASPYATCSKRVRHTPQSEPIDARQVKNNAGGFVYALDIWQAFERFLILGTEGGTYYVGEKTLTQDGAKNAIKCIETDGRRAVDLIVDVSDKGRAAKNDPALFALALAAATTDPSTRSYALSVLPKVARIPTHLFHFVDYVNGMRGWGRGLRTAVSNWYNNQSADKLAYSLVKYQSRDGWSNKDVAILAHPRKKSGAHGAVFDWVLRGKEAISELTPDIILSFYEAQNASPKRIAELIRERGLSREMVPTSALNERVVWEALLEKMPMTALIRNLGNLSKIGLTDAFSEWTAHICAQLGNQDALRKARVHPLVIFNAMKTYGSGHGFRGSSSWTVNPKIVDALDAAFYLSFGNVVPTNKNILLALDISGSMDSGTIAGTQISPREATAALALITANVEPKHHFIGFTSSNSFYVSRGAGRGASKGPWGEGLSNLTISPKQRLDDVIKYLRGIPMGGTDCALPMLAAEQNRWNVDAFCIYTDNETWAGGTHPMQALRSYRNASGVANAKLLVTGLTATNFTIADPNDPLTLDVVGFDLNAPHIMSEFIRG